MISSPIQLRFADIDMAGHVHNGAYLHYFETARINFFLSAIDKNWDWKKNGFILKKNTIEYHQPVYLTDKITVEVSTVHIGEKSFTLSYRVIDAEKQLKTTGESIIVCFDFLQGRTIPIPGEVLSILKAHLV